MFHLILVVISLKTILDKYFRMRCSFVSIVTIFKRYHRSHKKLLRFLPFLRIAKSSLTLSLEIRSQQNQTNYLRYNRFDNGNLWVTKLFPIESMWRKPLYLFIRGHKIVGGQFRWCALIAETSNLKSDVLQQAEIKVSLYNRSRPVVTQFSSLRWGYQTFSVIFSWDLIE